MANVLSDDKRQQVIALGRLHWPLRRIQEATGVRRETASEYLKSAGIPVRGPRQRTLVDGPKPASEVPTDSATNPASEVPTDPAANPASEVPTDHPPSMCCGQKSACEPYRSIVEDGMRRGRNAVGIYQDLVGEHGFRGGYCSVRRFV